MYPFKSTFTVFVLYILAPLAAVQAQAGGNFDSTIHTLQAIKIDSLRIKSLTAYEKEINRAMPEKALEVDSILLGEAVKAHDVRGEMRSNYRISVQYNMLNNYSASLKASFRALDLAAQVKDYHTEGMIYVNQANVYEYMDDTLHLHKSIGDALSIAHTQHDTLLERDATTELGVFYNKQGLHQQAIEAFQRSFDFSVAMNDAVGQVNCVVNLAITYKTDKQYSKALAAYNRGLVIADSLHDDYVRAVIFDNRANLEFEMGNYTACETDALLAIKMSYQVEEKEIRVDLYNTLEKLYEKEKRYPEAIDYFGRLAALKDSLLNEENLAQINDMNQKYQASLKDRQITSQRAQINGEHKLNIILGACGVAAFMAALLIYFNLRKTARLNRTVSSQRDALGKQSEKLSVMMKELHHRVKNNLQIVSSLLNLQSLKLTDTEAVNAVQESKQRVQAMSLIHQRLYKTDDITRINMREYIKELADFLAISYGRNPENFCMKLDAEEEWVDIDKALPLGLILNELISNAFKYAFDGIEKPCLQISFKRGDGNITLQVKDNGKGLQPGQWGNGKTSFGNQLVKALCSQLRAKETVETTGGAGFTFVIPEAAA